MKFSNGNSIESTLPAKVWDLTSEAIVIHLKEL
jgi:hypothetical protein